MLQAKSRHRDLRTLSVYTRPGPEAVAPLTDDQFDWNISLRPPATH